MEYTIEDIEERGRCRFRVDGYCSKIRHEILGGHAIISHCLNCPYFED